MCLNKTNWTIQDGAEVLVLGVLARHATRHVFSRAACEIHWNPAPRHSAVPARPPERANGQTGTGFPSDGIGPPSAYFFARSSTSWFRMSTTFSAISLLNRTLLFRHMLAATLPFEITAMYGALEKT